MLGQYSTLYFLPLLALDTMNGSPGVCGSIIPKCSFPAA